MTPTNQTSSSTSNGEAVASGEDINPQPTGNELVNLIQGSNETYSAGEERTDQRREQANPRAQNVAGSPTP